MKSRKRDHRKRLELKRMNRNKRSRKRSNPFRLEWITDTMFSLRFHDEVISRILQSVTEEMVDDD
jgi:hypothetical protein